MSWQSVLKFWFEETDRKFHFNATPAFDADIRAHFEDIAIEQAALAAKGNHPWANEPERLLALAVTLDQFPRNMYRGTPAMFEWDSILLPYIHSGIKDGMDLKISMDRRAFIYMPLMHSEDVKDQNLCVKMADQRLSDDSTLFHAKAHRKLIKRFGRFPHRNDILGRPSTDEELRYMRSGGYSP